jgi:hypothetical protein
MKHTATTLEHLRRALAEQDAQLAASFVALDPRAPIGVPIETLRLFAEKCAGVRSRLESSVHNTWGSVRC